MTGKNKRKDPAWKYGKEFLGDEEGEQGKKKPYIYIDCNFCHKIIKGGVLRMKHHLAGSHENSQPCESAPPEVVEEMKTYLAKGKKVKEIRQENFDFLSSRGSYYGGNGEQEVVSNVQVQPNSERGVRGPMDCFVVGSGASGERGSNEPRIMAPSAKERRDNVCLDIGRFFFENGLPFYIATSPSFANMIRSIGEYGRGLRPPSMYELRTWILTEEVNTTKKMVDDVKKTWPSTGVTIMSDGWTDMRGRTLINFLVNNPEGTVFLKCVDASDAVKDGDLLFKLLDEIVEEVGEEHVVQVCTDNAPNYKKVGKLLMEKRPHLYWTPCSAHCLDLILESLYTLPQLVNAVFKAKKVANYIYNHGYVLALMRKYTKTELVRPAVTRFATANLTLESLLRSKQDLEEMFASRKWTTSKWGRTRQGKGIRKIILNDPNFWPSVSYSLKVTRPLVKVLRIVDSEKEPAMGFLYGAMDQAKEEIKNNLDNDISKYKEIWDIIDEKWDMRKEQRDLHAAACYLNPQIHYEPGATFNSDIMTGLYNCLDRLIVDIHERDRIHLELDKFKGKHGMFGRTQAETTRKKRSPANWWLAYGIEQPSLMNFAVRVLSLTCSSSACERNWSTFNQVHTKRRNRLDQKSMVALVYVMYNKKLKINKLLRKTKVDKEDVDPLVRDDIESDNEWVASQDQEIDDEGSGSGTPNENPLEENHIEEDTNIIDENLDELDVEGFENQIGIDEEDLDEAIQVPTTATQKVDDVRGKRPMQTQPTNVFSRRNTLSRGGSNARGGSSNAIGGSNARGGSSNARGGSNARGVNVTARGGSIARRGVTPRRGSNASSRGGASARGRPKRGRKRKLTIGDKHMREIDAEDEDPEWMNIGGEDDEDDSMDDESSGEDEDLEDEEDGSMD